MRQPDVLTHATHVTDERKFTFVWLIHFIRSKLPLLFAHVTGVSDPVYMSIKIRKFRTDKFDT